MCDGTTFSSLSPREFKSARSAERKMTMISQFSRRAVLALTGGGVVGLAAAAQARDAREEEQPVRHGEVRNYQPLPFPPRGVSVSR